MVDRQLRRRAIHDARVLAAMSEIPRECFVPTDQRPAAYEDRALPLDFGQTISQPFTVAFMCQALELQGHERVLEIGTGSGYAAAVLSRLAGEVHSIDRISSLAADAERLMNALGVRNVHVHCGDGTLGLSEEAPFDAIVATAGGTTLPEPFRAQLADGGRIVIPLHAAGGSQTMWRFTRLGNRFEQEDFGRFAFVPLVGKYGWADLTDDATQEPLRQDE